MYSGFREVQQEEMGEEVAEIFDQTVVGVVDADDTLMYTTRDLQGDIHRLSQLKPAAGAIEFLRRWKKKFVVVSVGVDAFQREKLRQTGLLDLVHDEILVMGDSASKAAMIETLAKQRAEKYGPSVPRLIGIGDRIDNDIVPCKKAGFVTVWVRLAGGKYHAPEPSVPEETPDHIVSDFEELMKLPIFPH